MIRMRGRQSLCLEAAQVGTVCRRQPRLAQNQTEEHPVLWLLGSSKPSKAMVSASLYADSGQEGRQLQALDAPDMESLHPERKKHIFSSFLFIFPFFCRIIT